MKTDEIASITWKEQHKTRKIVSLVSLVFLNVLLSKIVFLGWVIVRGDPWRCSLAATARLMQVSSAVQEFFQGLMVPSDPWWGKMECRGWVVSLGSLGPRSLQ